MRWICNVLILNKANRYGGRLVFGFGVLGTAVLTLLTPPLALLGYPLLLLARVLEGMCEVRDIVQRFETNDKTLRCLKFHILHFSA